MKIKWDKEATLSFNEAIRYIRKRSLQNAEKVKSEILYRINNLANGPEIYPPDKYK